MSTINHPLDKLMMYNNMVYFSQGGQPRSRYMGGPAIVIAKKVSYEQRSGEFYDYFFQLNLEPDQVWETLFREIVADRTAYTIKQKTFSITARHSEIQRKLDAVKAAINETNETYQQVFNALVPEVQTEQAERERRAKEKAEQDQARKDEFDNLKL